MSDTEATFELMPSDDDGKQRPFSRLVYAIFLLFGVALLTPWNVIINSFSFLRQLYSPDQPLRAGLSFYMTAASSYPGVPFLFIMLWYGSLVPARTRIVCGCLLQALCLVLLPVLSPASPWVPILLTGCTGMATSVLQSSLMGLASQFPPAYSQAFSLGQGVAGIIASAGQVLVQLLLSANVGGNTPTYFYFALATTIMLSGAAAAVHLHTLPLAQGYIQAASTGSSSSKGGEEDRVKLLEAEAEGEDQPAASSGSQRPASLLAVLCKAWRGLLSIFLVYFFTFLLFPNVMLESPYRGQLGQGSAYLGTNGWWGIVLLALFNSCDTLGRFLPAYPGLAGLIPKQALLPLTVARALFIPLFWGCVKGWGAWMGDLTVVAGVVLFGLSNGCFTTLAIIRCPEDVDPWEKETVGFLLSLLLNLGILAGSQGALLFVNK